MDWLSRAERKFLNNKPLLLMSTSPGKGGGKRALRNLEMLVGDFAPNVIGTFSLPEFNTNFDKGITEEKSIKKLERISK